MHVHPNPLTLFAIYVYEISGRGLGTSAACKEES